MSDVEREEEDDASQIGGGICMPLLRRSSRLSKGSLSSTPWRKAFAKIKTYNVKSRRNNRRRSHIPAKKNKMASLVSVMRSFVGKDLTTASLPVPHCEPLTTLQRLTEDMDHANLLDFAAAAKSHAEEMAYIAAFSISAYSCSVYRHGKPFNAILGETFECDRSQDKGWRCIAEQVLADPPTAAVHCEGRKWVVWFDLALITKFRGRSLEVTPVGSIHVKMKTSNRHYSWQKVHTYVHNVMIGSLWVEHIGNFRIVERKEGYTCDITFKPASMFSRYTREISGTVKNPSGEVVYFLSGTWDGQVEGRAADTDRNVVLWCNKTVSELNANMYHFSKLAIELNELEDRVAPTDSRLRPDLRLMELGEWSLASEMKHKMEGSRRSSVISRLEDPLWFQLVQDEFLGEKNFVYTGKYWECKEANSWDACPNLFHV